MDPIASPQQKHIQSLSLSQILTSSFSFILLLKSLQQQQQEGEGRNLKTLNPNSNAETRQGAISAVHVIARGGERLLLLLPRVARGPRLRRRRPPAHARTRHLLQEPRHLIRPRARELPPQLRLLALRHNPPAAAAPILPGGDRVRQAATA